MGYEPNELPLLHPAMFVSAKVHKIFYFANFLCSFFVYLLFVLFNYLIMCGLFCHFRDNIEKGNEGVCRNIVHVQDWGTLD